jgi:hypothetical protein
MSKKTIELAAATRALYIRQFAWDADWPLSSFFPKGDLITTLCSACEPVADEVPGLADQCQRAIAICRDPQHDLASLFINELVQTPSNTTVVAYVIYPSIFGFFRSESLLGAGSDFLNQLAAIRP